MTNNDSAAQCKLLVVDDDEQFRGVMTQCLAKHGFEILGAATGAEGLALARQMMPDLVLCDLEMPGMDGYEVLMALRRDPLLTTMPVIFLTGRSNPAQVRFGMNLGADDYLTKPVNQDNLIHAIKARLARVRQMRNTAPCAVADSRPGLEGTLLVKTLGEKRLVKIRQITHILAYGEYSWVYWEKGKGVMLRKALKQWLAELPAEQFIRVHRGAIVNLLYLDRVERLPDGRLQVRLYGLADPIHVSLRLAPALNRKLRVFQPGNQPNRSTDHLARACSGPLRTDSLP